MAEFILKDRYGTEQFFDYDKIFVKDANGELIPFTQGEGDIPAVVQPLEVTENGTYIPSEGVDGYSSVSVNVPVPTVTLQDKTITENGIYTADSGYDGLGSVTVDVTGSGDGNADVCYVTFMSDDGAVVYGKKAVAVGDDCANPITRGIFDTPAKESNETYDYRFVNWADEMGGEVNTAWNEAITEDKIVYAVFEICGGTCGASATWFLSADHRTLTINGTGAMKTYYSTATGRAPWNTYWSSIKTINVSSGITHISQCAFHKCTALTSITIPESVTSIGMLAFGNCTSLTSVVIPATVTSMDGRVFSGCSSLKSATFNCAITTLSAMMFENCTSLTSFTIPESVTTIGNAAFYYCPITSIVIPANVTSIVQSTFFGCDKLTSATFKTTTGWSAGSTALSSSSLANKTTAATYLRSTYVYRDWTRTE